MAYTRTQVFNHINLRVPFIRSLFHEFDVEPTEALLGTQYMYGPSIMAFTDLKYSNKIFPGNWCSVHSGISYGAQICFQGPALPSTADNLDGKQMMFMREGTITPLYDFNRSELSNMTSSSFTGAADLSKLSLDLHVFNDLNGNGTSKGELLLDDGVGKLDNKNYCYMTFSMANATILFVD